MLSVFNRCTVPHLGLCLTGVSVSFASVKKMEKTKDRLTCVSFNGEHLLLLNWFILNT